jgi:hypothetical protein
MKSQMWTESREDRRSFIGSSDARIIMGAEPALLPRWREKRGAAEPEDLSGKPGPSQPRDCAGAKPSASPVRAAHTEFVAALAGHPPRTIPLDADAIDLQDRADHLESVFSAFLAYVTVVLDDTAQNVPGGIELPQSEAVLIDLASDITGPIQHAADRMAGSIP